MKHRAALAAASAALPLALFLNPFFANAADNVIARVNAVTPCADLTGAYLVTLGNAATSSVIYKNVAGASFSGQLPASGDDIFGVLGDVTSCTPSSGSGTPVSARILTFFEPQSLTLASSRPNPTHGSSGSGGSSFSGLGSSLLSTLPGILQQIQHYFTPQSLTQGMQTVSSALGGAAGIGNFGGFITPTMVCDEGFLYTLTGAPYTGPLMWTPGISSVPPYLCALGTQPKPGYTVGHYQGFSPCTVSGVVVGGGPIMYGYGTSCPVSSPAKPGTGTPSTGQKGNLCKNTQNDAYTKSALQQYGGNLLSGNVPDLSSFCPNFSSLSSDQRLAFWTNFVDAVELPESSCNPGTVFHETDSLSGTLSEGLLQLSVGDSARGHSGACNLNSSNILDAQTNITCGVAIMDGLSSKGITNGNQGMDAYWSTLRAGKNSLANVQSVMSSFPGCH